jgi:hypothetical protein
MSVQPCRLAEPKDCRAVQSAVIHEHVRGDVQRHRRACVSGSGGHLCNRHAFPVYLHVAITHPQRTVASFHGAEGDAGGMGAPGDRGWSALVGAGHEGAWAHRRRMPDVRPPVDANAGQRQSGARLLLIRGRRPPVVFDVAFDVCELTHLHGPVHQWVDPEVEWAFKPVGAYRLVSADHEARAITR